jgi:hypothetical protein
VAAAADIFRQAAELNRDDPRRKGNVIHAGRPERTIIAGDFHGSRANLNRVLNYAAQEPPALLVLQEIIHGPDDPRTGHDRSAEVMLQAAQAKINNPENVIFLLGNHAVAQITGNEITKEGRGSCKAFDEGLRHCFGDDAPDVYGALLGFCRSMALAVRFDNGLLASHTLPDPRRMDIADIGILDRPWRGMDELRRGGAVYEWTWGRGQTAEQLNQLAEQLEVETFVLGHKHIETGFEELPARGLHLMTDDERGRILEFRADDDINPANICNYIKSIATLKGPHD